MKLTKSKLKQLIKEELTYVLREEDDWDDEDKATSEYDPILNFANNLGPRLAEFQNLKPLAQEGMQIFSAMRDVVLDLEDYQKKLGVELNKILKTPEAKNPTFGGTAPGVGDQRYRTGQFELEEAYQGIEEIIDHSFKAFK